jgi:hypothetical protein
MPKATRKTDAPADPDKLVRQSAGRYLTADERFEVREADVGWFLVDSTQSNEFGQELIHGPFATLKAVREAIPGARATEAAPIRRPKRKPTPTRAKAKAPPPPPPPSWIDQLPRADAARVRRQVRALESEGIADAEAIVRRDREGLFPAIATALIEQRLDALVAESPPKERDRTRALARRVAEILSGEGGRPPDPLPGWSLVERDAPKREINLSE